MAVQGPICALGHPRAAGRVLKTLRTLTDRGMDKVTLRGS